jgi:phenylalanyl-tRNA synthetase alpha subunit
VLEKHVVNKAPKAITASERLKFQAQIRELRKLNSNLEKQLTTALEHRSEVEGKLAKSIVHTSSQEAVEKSFYIWKRVIDKLLTEIEGAHFDFERRTIEDSIYNRTVLREKDFPEGFFDWFARSRN